ncbi:ATP-binding protein [Colwellia sp. E2M01]|uniref:ATP-binding protein n=1 Tax=Colwellia sp. E2M01 TaxID=2841561 RepID=UPI0020906462|nr:ATP-binding protein [Colwellia sp. E2M01]
MNSFEQHMNQSIENELSAYSYSILAVAEVEQASLVMPEVLIENQFNVTDSGLYAFISSPVLQPKKNIGALTLEDKILWRSQSSLTLNLSTMLAKLITSDLTNEYTPLAMGDKSFSTVNINNSLYFIYSFSVSFTDEEQSFPIIVHIVRDKQAFTHLINNFEQQLWLGLTVLMLVILLLQLAWLMWTLKPLSTLQQEIHAVERGKAEKLTSTYPKELSKLTNQVNQLLATEQKQRQRYRNALSDLAHSLKTPLAVMQAQSDVSPVNQEQINRINSTIDHQLKRAQSVGQSSWVLGIAISPIVDKLLNTLAKIYQREDKILNLTLQKNLTFKGDEADLLELLGNLLDNAYKAAKNTIKLTVKQQGDALIICVEDDGVGIENEQIESILQRGIRADTYDAGHGVGLAIVRDLVQSYQGKLNIGNSAELGGAMFTLCFSQSL